VLLPNTAWPPLQVNCASSLQAAGHTCDTLERASYADKSEAATQKQGLCCDDAGLFNVTGCALTWTNPDTRIGGPGFMTA
jgi:hypothetical protein